MEIDLDGSMFGTNNGTTNLIKMSRNVFSRNLVSRVGHEILETIPTHPAVVFIGLSTLIIYRY